MKAFIRKNRAFCAYLIIAFIIGVAGAIFTPGNELLYMILGQYLILPVAGLICSACCVKKGSVLGFISPFIFIVIAYALPFIVFRATDIAFLVFIGVPCIIGSALGLIGFAFSKLRKGDKKEKQELKQEKKQDISEAKAETDDFSVENDDANSSETNAPEEAEDEEPEILIAD